MGLSGNTLAGLSRYNQGLADQTYQQELQNLLAPVQIGQAAAAGQSANIGNAANNMSGIQMQQGQNQANIATGTIGGITGAISNGINSYTTMNTLKGLQGAGGGATPYVAPTLPDVQTSGFGIGG